MGPFNPKRKTNIIPKTTIKLTERPQTTPYFLPCMKPISAIMERRVVRINPLAAHTVSKGLCDQGLQALPYAVINIAPKDSIENTITKKTKHAIISLEYFFVELWTILCISNKVEK